MMIFEDQEAVEEWLETLDYEAFWIETANLPLSLQSRESCDEQIAKGIVDKPTVLCVLKGMARLQIVRLYGLEPRHPAEVLMH